MKRTIAVITTSRADYGHLYWPIRDLSSQPGVDLIVIALGPHLSPEFGNTVAEMDQDALPVHERLECLLSSDSDVGMAKTIGIATLGLADLLGRRRPELLLLIGDRYELLAPASVALALRIPIAHIEGGEVSEGAIDDAVRNALTKLGHIHLTTTESARLRVLAMGEEEWRVHRVGSPTLDHLRRSPLLAKEAVSERLGLDLDRPTLVVSCHPVTMARDTTREADALFAALGEVREQIAFCYPNADAGSRALIARAREFCAGRSHARVFVNLGHVLYWSLLRCASALLGNSSSGIMETASLGLPAVDVGWRQAGRERARNVLHAPAEPSAILEQLRLALTPGFHESLAGLENPYGDGRAAERIVKILLEAPLGERLLAKKALPLDARGMASS